MPRIAADELKRIGEALLLAAGALPNEAETVARQCAAANLAGHDSHGVIAIPAYIDRIKAGHIVPGAKWTIVQEFADHDRDRRPLGFRLHVVTERAMALTIEKARHSQRRRLHRVPPEPCRPARRLSADGDAGEGMIGLATADSRPFAQGSRAVRRPRGAARHQPDLDRGAVRSRGAALSRHGDVGGGGRQGRRSRPRAARKFRSGWIDRQRRQARPPTPSACGKAARCCRSAAPRATRAAASRRWSRCCAGCSPASASVSSRPGGTMTAASWRCSRSRRSARCQDSRRRSPSSRAISRTTPPSEGCTGVFYPGEVEYLRAKQQRRRPASTSRTRPGPSCALAGEYELTAELGLTRPRPGVHGREQHDAADGHGRLPAGAELHQPAGSWRHPESRDRFHVGRLLPGDRPDLGVAANSTWRSSTTGWRCPTATATTTPIPSSTASAA